MSDRGTPEQAPDQALLVQTLLGDGDALSSLVCRHYSRILGYLVRLSGDYHLAQDLTQETFYRMWQSLPRLRETMPFRTWLYRIAHNAFVDHVRSWHSRSVFVRGDLEGDGDVDEETTGPDPVPSIVERRLERSRARALLGRLSPGHRAVVVLRFYEELSLYDIAEALDLPLGTVKSRLHYAFRELRRLTRGDEGGRAEATEGGAAEEGKDD